MPPAVTVLHCRLAAISRATGNAVPPEGVDRAVVGRPPDNEAALVARARRGDAVAYGSLVRAHQDIAFRVACLAGGSAADAEEAAQEGFVKAWRALPRFRAGAPFRPWLLAIVANEARNRRRAAGRRAGLALRAAEQAERSAGSGGASPETLVLAQRAPRDAARRPRGARRARPLGPHLPLPARALRGGDGGRARLPARARSSRAPRARSSGCARSAGVEEVGAP